MKLQTPNHSLARGLAILVAGIGLGLILGSVWQQTEPLKILVGFGLAALAFVIMVFSDTGLL